VKPTFITCIVIIVMSVSSFAHAQKRMVRSSLSTAPQTAQTSTHTVQHSIGFMGIQNTKEHTASKVVRGFLLPHNLVSGDAPTFLEWSVYPVPFSTHINIDFSTKVTGDLKILLVDVAGKVVFDKTRTAQQAQKVYVGQLAQGTYFLAVSVMGKQFQTKLVNHATNNLN
jgi:hypothetical protein